MANPALYHTATSAPAPLCDSLYSVYDLFSFTFIERMFLCVPVCLLCIVCVCVCVFSATTRFCGELEFIYHREYREACWATALFSRTVKQWRDRVWGTGAPAPVDSTTATKTEWVVVVVESKRAAGSPAPDTRSRHCFAALGEHDGGIKTDDEASHVVISPRHATASLHAAIAATTRSDHTHRSTCPASSCPDTLHRRRWHPVTFELPPAPPVRHCMTLRRVDEWRRT